MLTCEDIARRFSEAKPENRFTPDDVRAWHDDGVLPPAIPVGGEPHWREEDIELWLSWLAERVEYREAGGDVDSPHAPAPPIFSSGGSCFDTRAAAARKRERRRQQRSKTLQRGSARIPDEALPTIPEPNNASDKAPR
jgi:hypothetical protein